MNIFETLSSLKGKTIENVTAKTTETGVKSFILYFTDGTQSEFYSSITFVGNDEYPAECEIQTD